jgi:SAM-dependent methyltransferase
MAEASDKDDLAILYNGVETTEWYDQLRPTYPLEIYQCIKDNLDRLRAGQSASATVPSRHIFRGFDVSAMFAAEQQQTRANDDEDSSAGPSLHVVDVGCGTGQVARALVEAPLRAASVLATDISPNMVKVGRRHQDPRIRWEVGGVLDAPRLAQQAGLSDVSLVTAGECFHWFPMRGPDNAIDSLRAFLLAQPRPAMLAVTGYSVPFLLDPPGKEGAGPRGSGNGAAVFHQWMASRLGPYWSTRVDHVFDGYHSIAQAFPEEQVRS